MISILFHPKYEDIYNSWIIRYKKNVDIYIKQLKKYQVNAQSIMESHN